MSELLMQGLQMRQCTGRAAMRGQKKAPTDSSAGAC